MILVDSRVENTLTFSCLLIVYKELPLDSATASDNLSTFDPQTDPAI